MSLPVITCTDGPRFLGQVRWYGGDPLDESRLRLLNNPAVTHSSPGGVADWTTQLLANHSSIAK